MRFQTDLISATLIRRYKRFLADVRLDDGREVTVHCPNPGAMTGLANPGVRVWLEPNDDPKKKLDFGWRLVELADGNFVGIDTGAANRIVAEALAEGRVPGLAGYDSARAEVKYGDTSRVDFLLSGPDRPDAFVEVKSVTLKRTGDLAEFPDTVTARGAKHMGDLARAAQAGHRAVVLFLVQRSDCTRVGVARDIDPAYARAVEQAVRAGVEVMAHGATLGPEGITLGAALPVAI